MPVASFTESTVEDAALEWFEALGYSLAFGPDIAPGEPAAERASYAQVLLLGRLGAAVARLNPHIPFDAQEDALRRLQARRPASLIGENRALHRMLVDGVEVEYTNSQGRIVGDRVRLLDFDHPDANDWHVVNQFTVIEDHHNRRPDIVVFINGLPLAVFELKDATDEQATIWSAFNQLQTYKHEIPSLFVFNEILVISDGIMARIGSLSADRERFMPWRTIQGEDLAPPSMPEMQVLIEGVFDKRRLLDYIHHFVVFEDDGAVITKKLAGYHQFHAVRRAVEETARAAAAHGDRRVGVVWHTQGSGKSLTMLFYAGRIVLHPAMQNPTVLVITDRNDLDDQLYGTFARCAELLRQTPVQAGSRDDLRNLLHVASGGVIFTTIQKFLPDAAGDRFPLLSDRRNIVVIADEAHRSQYDFIDGFARHLRDALPNASFIGFTGTPIELADKNTRAIFGDYISIYDVQRAVDDGATVPIYYESRLAKLALSEAQRPHLDQEFDEVTEAEEEPTRRRLRSKWAALEAVVGAGNRIHLIAQDLVAHFEHRQESLDGKAMVVCMSRRISVDLYNALVKLRPEWHSDNDTTGALKLVMTGSASDPVDWQQHIRSKQRREALATRFKEADNDLKIVIVRDMWLTGFDAPSLHTMYIDKPMRGHGLMQAIARVNRVFRDKPGGLVVDYLGLADQLRQALAAYTGTGAKGAAAISQEEAVAVMLEKYEIVAALFYNFDATGFYRGSAAARLTFLRQAMEHILAQEDGKTRLLTRVTELSKAFALAVPHEAAMNIRDDVAFYQAVRSGLAKISEPAGRAPEILDHAIRQIVSRAIASDQVIDIFALAGLDKPDISIMSDQFLAEVRDLPQRNLALEVLQKLLNDEIKARSARNLVQARFFSEMLERSIRAYQNRSLESAQVIEQLIELAKEMRQAQQRGVQLGLTDDELAFYDALEVNDSAVKVLGDETLRTIARELVDTIKKNTTVDWNLKESVRAKLRLAVKRILRKHGYPPDKQEQATLTVIQQAELVSQDWAA